MSAWCVSHWKPAKAAVWHWSHTKNLSVLSIIIILFYNKDKTSWTLLPAPTGQSGCLMLVKQDIHSLHLPLLFLFRESVKHPYCSLFSLTLTFLRRIKCQGLTLKLVLPGLWLVKGNFLTQRSPHYCVSIPAAFFLHDLQKKNTKTGI